MYIERLFAVSSSPRASRRVLPFLAKLLAVGALCFAFAGPGSAWVAAEEIGVRIRFGLNDEGPTDWDGAIETSRGKVAYLSGWRFIQDDKVQLHPAGWKASTHPVAQNGRGNNAKKAAAQAARRDCKDRHHRQRSAGHVRGCDGRHARDDQDHAGKLRVYIQRDSLWRHRDQTRRRGRNRTHGHGPTVVRGPRRRRLPRRGRCPRWRSLCRLCELYAGLEPRRIRPIAGEQPTSQLRRSQLGPGARGSRLSRTNSRWRPDLAARRARRKMGRALGGDHSGARHL